MSPFAELHCVGNIHKLANSFSSHQPINNICWKSEYFLVHYDCKVTIVVEQRTKSLNDVEPAAAPPPPSKCSGHNYIPVSNKWRIGVDLCLAESVIRAAVAHAEPPTSDAAPPQCEWALALPTSLFSQTKDDLWQFVSTYNTLCYTRVSNNMLDASQSKLGN